MKSVLFLVSHTCHNQTHNSLASCIMTPPIHNKQKQKRRENGANAFDIIDIKQHHSGICLRFKYWALYTKLNVSLETSIIWNDKQNSVLLFVLKTLNEFKKNVF